MEGKGGWKRTQDVCDTGTVAKLGQHKLINPFSAMSVAGGLISFLSGFKLEAAWGASSCISIDSLRIRS